MQLFFLLFYYYFYSLITDLKNISSVLTSGNRAKTRRPNTALKSTFWKGKGELQLHLSCSPEFTYSYFPEVLDPSTPKEYKQAYMEAPVIIPQPAGPASRDTNPRDRLHWAATAMNWPAAAVWMPCPRMPLDRICNKWQATVCLQSSNVPKVKTSKLADKKK